MLAFRTAAAEEPNQIKIDNFAFGPPEPTVAVETPTGIRRVGTRRMMREYRVRICEGLGVKFPGNHSARALFQAPGHGGRFTPLRGPAGTRDPSRAKKRR
jgi:hypothetical protein